MKDFLNPYSHGFVRLGVATPLVRVGDPQYNLEATAELLQRAARERVLVTVFPELGLSAYSCEDLFHQQALLEGAEQALAELLRRTRDLRAAALVGLPVAREGRLFNCAALIAQGKLIGVVPKIYLPNYREFYEGRQFTPGDAIALREIRLAGQTASFGTDLIFRHAESRDFVLHVEICEDLWVPAPSEKTKLAFEVAFLVNRAEMAVTSEETGAPLCSMNHSAGAPVDISAAIACAAK